MRQVWKNRCGTAAAAVFLSLVSLPLMSRHGLWFDEMFSVVMSRSLGSIWHMVATQENNMLLHYLFLWLWLPLGDGSEFFLRSSALLLVLLSLLPLYAAAKQLFGETVARVAPLLYVSHFLVLEYARSCRGYSLVLLMSALVLWRWVAVWHSGRWRDWIIVGVLAGFGVWAHYFFVLVPPVLLCAMLWRDGFKQPWHQLGVATALFVLVALPIVLTRPPDGAAQIGWANVPSVQSIRGTLWMLVGANGLQEQPLLMVIWVVCGGALLWRWRKKIHNTRSVAVGLLVGLVLMVLAVLVESFFAQPVFVYRFFTPLVPIFSLVFAVALCCVWVWLRWVLVALLLLSSAYETWKPYVLEPVPLRSWWKPMAQHLVMELLPGDIVLSSPAFENLPVNYYLDVFDVNRRLPRTTEYASASYRWGGGVEPEPNWQRLQALSNSSARIWLVGDEQQIPAWIRLKRTRVPAIRELLLRDRVLSYDWHFGPMCLQRFDRIEPSTGTSSSSANPQR